MGDILRRSLAPITEEAWKEIEEEANRTLKPRLSARRIVDFSGPHGWELGAVNAGRLHIPEKHETNGVTWGIREVLPLIEARIPFTLDQMELDSITRGAADADLEPVTDSADKLARFEESVLYDGFDKAGIKGLLQSSDHKALPLGKDAEKYPSVVAEGVKMMRLKGIGGPYDLVLGSNPYHGLDQTMHRGYPIRRFIKDITQGDILWSPVLKGGVLISKRGGDFEMAVGQDISIGYASHDRDKVELYLTESFTFRVIEPAAVVQLKAGS